MKALLLLSSLFVLLVSSAGSLYGQCNFGTRSLLTQADVDQFAQEVQNCTSIEGDLTISYLEFQGGFSDLSPLSHITDIEGTLVLHAQSADTTTITGLGSLEHVDVLALLNVNVGYLDLSQLSALRSVGQFALNGLVSHYPPALDSIEYLFLDYMRKSTAKLSPGVTISEKLFISNNATIGLDSLTFLSEAIFAPGIDVGFEFATSLYTEGLNLPSSIDRFYAPDAQLKSIACLENVQHANVISAEITGSGDLSPLANLLTTNTLELSYLRREQAITGLSNLNALENLQSAESIFIKNLAYTPDLSAFSALTNCKTLSIHNSELASIAGINPMATQTLSGLSLYNNPQLEICNALWICDALDDRDRPFGIGLIDNGSMCNPEDLFRYCSNTLGTVETSHTYLDRNCNGIKDNGEPALEGARAEAIDTSTNHRGFVPAGRSDNDGMTYFFKLVDTLSVKVVQLDTGTFTPNPIEYFLDNNGSRMNTVDVGFCTSTGTDSITLNTMDYSIMVPKRYNFAPFNVTNEGLSSTIHRSTFAGNNFASRVGFDFRNRGSRSVRDTLLPAQQNEYDTWLFPSQFSAGKKLNNCVTSVQNIGGLRMESDNCFDVDVLQSDTANQVFGEILPGPPERGQFTFTLDNVVSDTARNIFIEVEADARIILSSIEHIFMDPRFTFSRDGRTLRWEANNILQFNYNDRFAHQAGAVFRFEADLSPQFTASETSIDFGYYAEFDGIPFTSSQITITAEGVSTSSEVAEALDVIIAPNPAQNSTTVSISGETFAYQVFDSFGKGVLAQPRTATSHDIDLNSMVAGMYFIRLKTASGKRITKKLLVAK